MRRWREGERVDSMGIFRSCGRMWTQKQRGTSRLKKTCMNASEKASVVLLACLIPVTLSQPLLSMLMLSALFLTDNTADC